MEKEILVELVTPAQTSFSGEALAVSLPGAKAPFQILYRHAPIVSALETGVIKVETNPNSFRYFATEGGFVEVSNNKVSIVVESAVESIDIDVQQVQDRKEGLLRDLELETNIGRRDHLKQEIEKVNNLLHTASLNQA